jgi:hypothetical protein
MFSNSYLTKRALRRPVSLILRRPSAITPSRHHALEVKLGKLLYLALARILDFQCRSANAST